MPLTAAQARAQQDATASFLSRVVVVYLIAVVLATVGMLALLWELGSDAQYRPILLGTWALLAINSVLMIAAIRGRRRFASIAVFFLGTIAIVIYGVTIFADAQVHLLIIGLLFAAFVFLHPDEDRTRWIMGLFGFTAFLFVEFGVSPGSGLVPIDSELNRQAATLIRVSMAAHIAVDVGLLQYRFMKSRTILSGVARYAELRATTDELTGLFNRRPVVDHLADWAGGTRGAFAVAIIDVDDLKAVNDESGHDCGDALIQHVATTLRRHFRERDIVSRWGGDEFLVLMAGVRQEDLRPSLERLRSAVKALGHDCGGRRRAVSVSIGAALAAPGQSADQVIASADRVLYLAKQRGRDRVEVLGEDDATPAPSDVDA